METADFRATMRCSPAAGGRRADRRVTLGRVPLPPHRRGLGQRPAMAGWRRRRLTAAHVEHTRARLQSHALGQALAGLELRIAQSVVVLRQLRTIVLVRGHPKRMPRMSRRNQASDATSRPIDTTRAPRRNKGGISASKNPSPPRSHPPGRPPRGLRGGFGGTAERRSRSRRSCGEARSMGCTMTPRRWRKRRMRLLTCRASCSMSSWPGAGAGWDISPLPSRSGA